MLIIPLKDWEKKKARKKQKGKNRKKVKKIWTKRNESKKATKENAQVNVLENGDITTDAKIKQQEINK